MDAAADASYPPLFRRAGLNRGSDLPPSGPNRQTSGDLEIPVVDLQALDPSRLGEACREWGIFRLANHGIPPAFVGRLLDRTRSILSSPFESKLERFTQPVAYFWGTPVVNQRVRSLNWLEGLHVQRLSDLKCGGGDGGDPELGSCSSSFRSLVDEYGRHMARISRMLFDALALNLKLDDEKSASYLSEFDGVFRVLRYPFCPDTSDYLGLDSHTDSSVISILNQNQVRGLQILHDGQWSDVEPIPDTLIVNLGDMMKAMSSDEYRSVEHRVLASSGEERISLCYFSFPKEDALITSSSYRAFSYREFKAKVKEDIEATGFKIGLEQFRV